MANNEVILVLVRARLICIDNLTGMRPFDTEYRLSHTRTRVGTTLSSGEINTGMTLVRSSKIPGTWLYFRVHGGNGNLDLFNSSLSRWRY